MNYSSIIKQPIITEKTSMMKDKFGQYVFFVDKLATAGKIRDAIEEIYKVKVLKINTLRVKPKAKRSFAGKRDVYTTQTFKKAMITLAEKDSIKLFEKTK